MHGLMLPQLLILHMPKLNAQIEDYVITILQLVSVTKVLKAKLVNVKLALINVMDTDVVNLWHILLL